MYLQEKQIEIIRKFIPDKEYADYVIEYLEKNEIVDDGVFDNPNKNIYDIGSLLITDYNERRRNCDYYPVSRDIFLKRIPFYFEKISGETLKKWISSLLYSKHDKEENVEEEVEKIYNVFEFFYYDAGLSLDEIRKYPDYQLTVGTRNEIKEDDDEKSDFSFLNMLAGRVISTSHLNLTTLDILYRWHDYVRICKDLKWHDYIPDRLITKFNEALEAVELEPIIYGIETKSVSLGLEKEGRCYTAYGNFPCDGMGRPIMKWIALRLENVKNLKCTCERSAFGELSFEVQPDSMVSSLQYLTPCDELAEPTDEFVRLTWGHVYAGPKRMFFHCESLKHMRIDRGMTQKELADAIEVSVRTYQKWENGTTKPDCQSLLRIMNWLDISDSQDLIYYEMEE